MDLRLAALLALAAAPAAADPWHCRNRDLEVACADGACSATVGEGFTPMDIAFDERGGISACVYSGCWEGQATPSGDDRYLSLVLRGAVFSPQVGDEPVRGDLALLFDREARVATFLSGGFVQPLVCRPADAGDEDAPAREAALNPSAP